MKWTVLGINVAKQVFQLHGVDERGWVIRQKRVSRSKLRGTVAQRPACVIGMGVGNRVVKTINHQAEERLPKQYVPASNLAERAFAEERRSTKVILYLQGRRCLVQLAFAVLIRVGHKWNKKSFRVPE